MSQATVPAAKAAPTTLVERIAAIPLRTASAPLTAATPLGDVKLIQLRQYFAINPVKDVIKKTYRNYYMDNLILPRYGGIKLVISALLATSAYLYYVNVERDVRQGHVTQKKSQYAPWF
eukprot:TRINITY_DN7686_c0_g1_i1.p2 TRINITY_DN7686_c0_g1~~TRINITY_DN7686_c0_g1_i1.p2  ORF type:complete len:119 (+),score=57.17 TRINITY_DN7686_c0_g1_i1:438-794(+)